MFKIVLSHALCDKGMEVLYSQKDVVVTVANESNEEKIMQYLVDADAFILRIGKINSSMLEKCPNMKVIARPGVGYDTIDVEYATQKGIPVVVTPGANSRSVAEQVMMFLLMISKNYIESYSETIKGNYSIRNKYSSFELNGKTIGICGFGNIGKIVAELAIGFGMKVIAYDPFVSRELCQDPRIIFAENLNDLLSQSDVVTLHVASTEKTRGMISKKELAMMKEGSILINCARGDLVDEDALFDALKSEHLLAAAEDMMVKEPFDLNNKLFSLKNFFVSPHMAALTKESSERCALKAIEGTLSILRGEKWPLVVDKKAYENGRWIQ